jgi:hypothetical protein
MQYNISDINVPTFRYNLSLRWVQIPEDAGCIRLWTFDKYNQTTRRRFRKASSYNLALLSRTVAPRQYNMQSRISDTTVPWYRSLCMTCPDTRMWHTWSSHTGKIRMCRYLSQPVHKQASDITWKLVSLISAAPQPNSGLGSIVVQGSRSQLCTHAHTRARAHTLTFGRTPLHQWSTHRTGRSSHKTQ